MLAKIKAPIKRALVYFPILRNWWANYRFLKACPKLFKDFLRDAYWVSKVIQKEKITLFLDVGAHAGESIGCLRSHGYFGRVISFEPLSEIFKLLKKQTELDPLHLWECHNTALGNENGMKKFNVLKNTPASSFLEGEEILEKECGEFLKHETVSIRRLEELYPSICQPSDAVFLKIDAQGFEKEILEGTGRFLQHVRLVNLEVSFQPIYKGEILATDMIKYMESKGFIPILIQRGHVSQETLHQLQADILFYNQNPQTWSK